MREKERAGERKKEGKRERERGGEKSREYMVQSMTKYVICEMRIIYPSWKGVREGGLEGGGVPGRGVTLSGEGGGAVLGIAIHYK